MKLNINYLALDGQNPFTTNPALGTKAKFNQAIAKIKGAYNGGGVWSAQQFRPKAFVGTVPATGVISPTGVQAADTVTLNGQALTATQQRATGTLTCASAIAGNTVVVNGHTFTAVAGAPAANQFSIDTGDNETATSLSAAINTAAALVANTNLYQIVAARVATNVVTVYSYAAPLTAAQATAANAVTLATTGGTITRSAATLANGAAAANNQFDYIGTNVTTAASLIYAIHNSTTSLVSGHFWGNNRSAIVTCSNVSVGDTVTLAGEVLTAGSAATDSGGNRITTAPPNFWSQGSTDTNDAVSLVNCINSHPRLSQLFFAANSSGAVTIRERYPTLGKEATLQSSNGTRLAVTGTVSNSGGLFSEVAGVLLEGKVPGVAGNACTIATSDGTRLPIAGSASRLLLGASTSFTF